MRTFSKEDLKQLYLEEEIIQKNKCINSVVNIITELVISNAKIGAKQTRHEYCSPKKYYHDEYVKTEIESTLKRIFIDSVIEVKTEDTDNILPPTLIVSVDWS
jgi:hypothetical protein